MADPMRILSDPLCNKGTAFTRDERRGLGIEGLLPPRVESLEEQAARVAANLQTKASPLDRYLYLAALQGENETLYYRVLLDHLEELLPVVYTPTVGEACLQWSRIYLRPRGLYISARHRGRIAEVLRNWRREARIIVVTDGGRILGLGDLGANGLGIPIGKLALYTACAGVRPDLCLPVALDVGTDNEALRADPLYLGERESRLTGEPWDALLEEFVTAAQAVFPSAIVQFEDFNNASAFRLLARYRSRLCCFDDDVQGTGAMGLAGLYAAGRITGRRLSEQRILFAGAGEACLGIGHLVAAAMQREGLSEAEAKRRCLFVDSRGLVIASRADLAEHKRAFAQERAPAAGLREAIESFRPTALVGATGKAGLFTRPVLEAMARVNERPVILALSNPTSKAECTAEQAYSWTEGRAVFAAGSPFAPVTLAGRVHVPGQANNSYIFPGVGLGLLFSGAKRVTDEMFLAAARALAGQVSETDLAQGRIYPAPVHMREVAAAVAAAVAQADADAIARPMYQPRYS
jgi:malate dehydrogenase (oxaloacetate-decarboxylating)(NADP+)